MRACKGCGGLTRCWCSDGNRPRHLPTREEIIEGVRGARSRGNYRTAKIPRELYLGFGDQPESHDRLEDNHE